MTLVSAELGGELDDAAFAATKAQAAALGADADGFDAQFLRGETIEHHAWLRLHNERERLRWSWHDFFRDWDVLLAPVASTPAFPHDHSGYFERTLLVDNSPRPYFEQIFWAGFVGVAHLPSTVIPASRSREGLPVGVQIIGPAYGDRVTIGVARLLEDAGFKFTPPPAYA
jgi:amidase